MNRLLLAGAAVGLLACGITPVIKTEDAPKAQECATKQDTSLAEGRIIKRHKIVVERINQRVIRKAKDGAVKSDKVETTKSPTDRVALEPQGKFEQKVEALELVNRQTCDSAELTATEDGGGLFSGLFHQLDKNGKASFIADVSPALLHLKVNPGENFIDYRYRGHCLEAVAGDKQCPKRELLEEGTLVLTVEYSVKTIEETQEITDSE